MSVESSQERNEVSCSAGQINKLSGLQLLVYGPGNKAGREARQLVAEIQSYVTDGLTAADGLTS
jgi:hypothetical protein